MSPLWYILSIVLVAQFQKMPSTLVMEEKLVCKDLVVSWDKPFLQIWLLFEREPYE